MCAVAPLRHADEHQECLLIGVDRKRPPDGQSEAIDPSATSAPPNCGSEFMEYPLSAQSIFSASALTIGAQRATSAARVRRNFSGFESRVGSIPASINICLYAGSATAVRVACAICSMIPIEVPAGASSPMEPVTVMPGKPSSAAVGSSGAAMSPQLAGPMEFEHLPGYAGRTHWNLSAD